MGGVEFLNLKGICHGGLKTRKLRRKCKSKQWWHSGKHLKDQVRKEEFDKTKRSTVE